MNVVWTDTAQQHLDAIHDHIAQDSKQYALKMVDNLTRRSIQIADFPLSGRVVPKSARIKFVKSLKEVTGLFITSNLIKLMSLQLFTEHRRFFVVNFKTTHIYL